MAYKKSKVKRIIEQELREFFGKRREREWKKIAGTDSPWGQPDMKATSDLGKREIRNAIKKASPPEFHDGIQRMLANNILTILSVSGALGLLEEQPQPLGGVPPRADAGPIAARRREAPSSVGSPTATVTLKANEVFVGLDEPPSPGGPPAQPPIPPETKSEFLVSLAQILNSQFGEHIRFAAEEQAAPAEAEAAPAEAEAAPAEAEAAAAGDPIVAPTMKWLKDIQSGKADRFMSAAVDINDSGAADEFVRLLLADVAKRAGFEEEDAGKGVPKEMLNRLMSAVQGRLNSLGAAAPGAAAAAPPEEASPWKRAELHGLGSPGAAGPRAEPVKPASLHGLGSGRGRSPATPGPGMRRKIPGGKAAPAAAGKPKRPASSRRRDARLAKLKGFEPMGMGPGSKGAVSSEAILDLDLEAEDENLLGDFLRDRGYEITEAQIKRMKEIAGIK